jgi:mycofactocin precursor
MEDSRRNPEPDNVNNHKTDPEDVKTDPEDVFSVTEIQIEEVAIDGICGVY